jgi:hypothetical protein
LTFASASRIAGVDREKRIVVMFVLRTHVPTREVGTDRKKLTGVGMALPIVAEGACTVAAAAGLS